ncbi:carbohydrate kinase family protein [Accumulibacter sp.]|uniref:carbohydrate kinase family protein n=1 Tax=Accumulibacter sp. TaxID=2053492 RepID=UPI0025E65738|nr:carbohydrate kinase family protein [Accumulibacter sp.]MCM8593958.1 carbohydrate kinase family protein [Accumulibacter sp.]MCM8627807.1 carbohydrate kinase family protein [Accumulibacter sp.]MDS4048099.1 carbohydrate kinase family protein [Accumulibacter sp.]
MSILICGSIAFDNIMVFHDRFRNHILPEQIHILNVAFLVPEMRREFGGCAGNIAYNLKLLGGEPAIMATVGDDADAYLARLDELGLSRAYVRRISGSFTAQAFITTDLDDNQITAFHPGAMSFSHHNRVAEVDGATLAIVAPDGRDGMLQHAVDLSAAGVPFVFDPGQGLPMFSGDDLMKFMRLATYACFNDYEAKLLCDRTGRPLDRLAREVEALVVTRGGAGSHIHANGRRHEIPCVRAEAVVDPTGCGDAYRSGLLYGISAGWDWEKTGRLAALMGAIKVAHRGGQNHRPTRDQIADAFARNFGSRLW